MSEIATRRAELTAMEYNPKLLEATVEKVLVKLYSAWRDVAPGDQDAIQAARRELARALEQPGLSGEEAGRLLEAFLKRIEGLESVVRLAYAELKKGKTPAQTFRSARGNEAIGSIDALYAAPDTGGDPLLSQGDAVPYHTKVDFPTSIFNRDESVQPLVVQLVINRPAQSRAETELQITFVDEATPELVEVHLSAPGFEETTGIHKRTLVVYKNEDSEPAIFLLKLLDKNAGDKELRLDFYHLGYPIGSATFKTAVTSHITGGPAPARTPPGVRPILRTPPRPGIGPGPGAPAPEPEPPAAVNLGSAALVEGIDGLVFVEKGTPVPDVILRVVRDADDKTLHFSLLSPEGKIGYRSRPMGKVTLQRLKDPTLLLGDYFGDLNQLARAAIDSLADTEAQDYQATIISIGNDLYEQIFPAELKAEYWRLKELREAGTIQTLLILSDEPWIPWEMLYPFDDTHGADDFLAGAWHLSRWQAGQGLNPRLNVQAVQLIAPTLDLTFVQEEQDYFEGIPAADQPVTIAQPITNRSRFLAQIAQGDVQLLHFATHANFVGENADRSPIHLEMGETITPVDLSRPATVGIRRERPVVFLNACHGGRLEFTLTGMGGWAERMVKQAAATAFVGAYWEINDRLASLFARTFYDELRRGATLAAAFQTARKTIREAAPANPTWLAYTLYGDPNAQVHWAKSSEQ